MDFRRGCTFWRTCADQDRGGAHPPELDQNGEWARRRIDYAARNFAFDECGAAAEPPCLPQPEPNRPREW
jgi:hypothetical protein